MKKDLNCVINTTAPVIIDGAYGTYFEEILPLGEGPDILSLTNPDAVEGLHLDYINAGAKIIKANTFGANPVKRKNYKEIISASLKCAQRAAASKEDVFVALDIAPTGLTPSLSGADSYREAYGAYRDIFLCAPEDAYDLILFETFMDLYELRAAIIAAKEITDKPIIATLTFEEGGRLLTGADPLTCVSVLEALGVKALGVNCGFGPDVSVKILRQLSAYSSLPLIFSPNAGLPVSLNGRTHFSCSPSDFIKFTEEAASLGALYFGGCCGTTPEYISLLSEKCSGITPSPPSKKFFTSASSGTRTCVFSSRPVVIGERLNPTGKKLVKEALIKRDFSVYQKEAIAQKEAGADIIDINTGIPDVNEAELLPLFTAEVQKVCDLPLQLDSSDTDALANSLFICNGKPVINSVNGSAASMEAVFPLAAKYGAALVALTLDETGIPDTPEGRAAIAKRILKKAAGYGIDKKDIIFDALTLAVATDPDSPYKTLKTVEYISKEMKCRTILGVSNISFGLPDRDAINADFLRKALSCGLSGAIINPMSALVMNVMREYQGGETNALPQDFCLDYSAALKPASVFDAHLLTLDELIYRGLSQDAAKKAQELLASDAKSNLIDGYIIPALNKISGDYDNKTAFLPQLIACADAAKAVFSVIEKHLAANPAERTSKGTIVIATVEGDIHDIGKNIVSSILSNYGFNVIDLGRNVPASAVLDALEKSRARLVGLSALMTTTVKSMEKTISFVRSKIPDCRFMVGGAVLTPEYAKQIGADYYAEDATAAVTIASEFFKV